jgi:hypothetical protein
MLVAAPYFESSVEAMPSQGAARSPLDYYVLGLRAAGADLADLLRALRGKGFSFPRALDLLLGLDPSPRDKLHTALEAVRGNTDLMAVRNVLESHGIHPASFAFAKLERPRIKNALLRMGLESPFLEWARGGRSISVEMDPTLAAIPSGLLLHNSELSLRFCSKLEDLGRGLEAEDLEILDCPAMVRLPEGFRSGSQVNAGTEAICNGKVWIEHCPSFRGFGRNTRLEGQVKVTDCPAFEGMGDITMVGGLWLLRSGAVPRPLDDGFTTLEQLFLENCPAVEELPDGLQVGGVLRLNTLPRLRRLPSGLRVGKGMVLRNCEALEVLPEDLCIRGDLLLRKLPALTKLPSGLQVEGNLEIDDCGLIEELPLDLDVKGFIKLTRLPRLKRLEEPSNVGGRLQICHCPRLESIPDPLWVGGSLQLVGLPGLAALPKDLQASRVLLSGCDRITELPWREAPAPHLEIEHCQGLVSLPAFGRPLESLTLKACFNLREIPNGMTVSPKDVKADFCFVQWPGLPEENGSGPGIPS